MKILKSSFMIFVTPYKQLHCAFLFLVYCIFFVIGLVGLYCKPQLLVIVIIIINLLLKKALVGDANTSRWLL